MAEPVAGGVVAPAEEPTDAEPTSEPVAATLVAEPPPVAGALERNSSPALRRADGRQPLRRASTGVRESRGGELPGYCNQRRHPRLCYLAAADRARDGLCAGDAACEAAFDSSPCIAERDSPACFDFIESRPCIDDATSFDCRLWSAAQNSYCAIEYESLYCGGSGSPGPEPFGRPGTPPTKFVGLVDTGISGRLALAHAPDPERDPRPLPMSGYEPLAPLLVATALLLAGACARHRQSG